MAHLRGVRGDGARCGLARLLPSLLQPGQLEELAGPLGLASSQLVRGRRVREAVPGGVRAGLLFIESYRELPLLTWPRKLIDAFVELEESMAKWRHDHARMVERIIGKRTGTGGTSGVDYLDATARYRIFKDLWEVRTILVKPHDRPALINAEFYGYTVDS